MTYVLLADGADSAVLAALDGLLSEVMPPGPPATSPARPAPAPGWDPDTWGTTPEAQSDLARAMVMFGGAG